MATTVDQKQPLERHDFHLDIDTTSNTTLYHIYHTGHYKNGYSIHTQSDSNTPLNRFPDPPIGTEIHTESAHRSLFSCRRTKTTLSKKISKAKALDNPRCDPRTETSPYFLHLPTLYGKNPPYTLRHGDILAQSGVVDGRGVVNIKYGTKKGLDGTFQGYEVRSKRYIGESGKAWHNLQAAQNEKVVELAEKPKPDEVVILKWTAPLSFHTREYQFTWRGFDFVWKGTQTVRPNKMLFRPFLHYNNLKLVVYIPGQRGEDPKELILARYTSVVSGRKSGRLEAYQHVIEYFLSQNESVLQQYEPAATDVGHCAHEEEKPPVRNFVHEPSAKTSQRFSDIVMGTAMCMILGEFTKRQVLVSVILALAGAYDG
ncbi:hypothetical protein DL98DRAFT_568618 [Cadophora sp. DSE1049]|nr:hypothetical protein DL98DRAFT_568618 [Cadophora sp. DSE1049]